MEENAKVARFKKERTSLKHRIGMAGFLFMERCLALMPMKFLCILGRSLGYMAYVLLPGRRHIVARNLRIVMNTAMRGDELKANVKENFKRMGANLIGAAKLSLLKDERLLHYVTIEHGDVFEAASHKGTGCICCVAHSGNWEVLARLRGFFPGIANYGSMYRQMDNPLLEDYLYKRRTGSGTQMFSKENGINRPFHFLGSENGYLGVLSDQFTQEGVFVPYFRKVTGTTYLPALLYKRTGTDMISVCVRTRRVGHWISNMGVSLNPTAIGKSLAEITIAVNQSLEKNLLESPLDGFWMHHRWKATANFAPRDPKVNKILAGMDLIPFRIIVVAPESLADAVAAVPMVRALRAARCDIEVMVACHRDQESFWKTVEAVSRVLPYADYKELRDQLWLPEVYNVGPYDAAILLDQSKSIAKAFAPFMPVSFFGLETHPLSKKLRFRIKAKTVTKDGKDQHRIEDYMGIAKKCSLETDTASFYPSVSQEGKQGMAVAWDGNRQIIEQIRTLPEDLQKQLKLVCLDGQKASLASFNLATSVVSGDAGSVVAELRQTETVIADGSTMVALANYAGAKCLAVMPDSETKKYRPWGEGHQMVTPQQVAEILRSCATLQEARVND